MKLTSMESSASTVEALRADACAMSLKHPGAKVLAYTIFSQAYLVVCSRIRFFDYEQANHIGFLGFWRNGKFENWAESTVQGYGEYLLRNGR